jgi:hypothetical protein
VPHEVGRHLGPEHLGRDPLHRPVVDQVDQVATDQQRIGVGDRPGEGVGGPVDVGDQLDPHAGPC